MTLLGTACREGLLKFGYVPCDRQVLAMDLYAGQGLAPRDLLGLRIELR